MKTREQVIKTNARKREFRWTARGAIKATLLTILVLILLIATVLGTFYGVHQSKTKKDIVTLDINNMYDIHEVNGIETNIYVREGINSQHTIVSIADIGDNTFGIYTNMIFEKVKDDVTIVNIDRPGYGMSADTNEEQTVENIIEHYRAALKEVNVSEPVVLFTYGFGSVYATEWATQYPDEVKAIVNINGTIIDKNNDTIESYEMTKTDYLYTLGNNFGIQRIFYDQWFNDMHRELTHDEEEGVQVLNTHSARTFALYSEMELKEKNFETVLENWTENDIPVFYIATEKGLEQEEDVTGYVEYMNALSTAKDEPPFFGDSGSAYDEFIIKTLEEAAKYQDEVLEPFIDKYNNAQIIKIPGYAKIYQQKAIAMDNFAADFVKWLNNDIVAMNDRYENEYPEVESSKTPEETEPVETEPTEDTTPTENN